MRAVALRLLGHALKLAAFLIGLFIFPLIGELNRHSANLGTWLEIASVFAVGTLVFRAGHKYSKLGKRHASRSADDLVAKDPRPPVIYLRSFRDDLVASDEETQWQGRRASAWCPILDRQKSSNWPRL